MLPSTHPKEQGHVQGVDEARPAETPRSWASQPVTASNTNELKKMQTSLPLNLASLGPLAQQAQDAQNTSLGGRWGKHQLLGEVWSRPLPKSFFSIWADLDILQIFCFYKLSSRSQFPKLGVQDWAHNMSYAQCMQLESENLDLAPCQRVSLLIKRQISPQVKPEVIVL